MQELSRFWMGDNGGEWVGSNVCLMIVVVVEALIKVVPTFHY